MGGGGGSDSDLKQWAEEREQQREQGEEAMMGGWEKDVERNEAPVVSDERLSRGAWMEEEVG